MISPIILNCEILPGTTIENAVYKATQTARDLNVLLRMNFNGVDLLISSSSILRDTVEEYYEQLKKEQAC